MTPNADWIMASILYGGRIQLYNGFSSTLSGSLHIITCLYIKEGLTEPIQ